ncbi:hypothetical protein BASA83_005296 [Batrachochytrium salamandrivorans]|nr:hypothetical protein BASA83_005296 [Batrachochytrium salamandrivorans]
MGPEVVCRRDLRQMDSSHSDCYRQTVYHSNLDVLAASAISDAADCLECPTALLQFCDIALDDGPLRPAPSTATTDMAIAAPVLPPTRIHCCQIQKGSTYQARRLVNSTDL